MKYQCEMIQDLLPLYKDGVCSPSTKQVVEEHLDECPDCMKLLERFNNTAIDELMVRERDTVIESQSRFFKRKSAIVGSVIAAVFAIPILVCLIVNLASGHALTWFYIVLAAMLVPSALFVVPLMAPKNRMFLTMTSFTASIILLLGVISIYTRGDWFFVAASAVLFGLTLCFSPFIACRRPVNAYLGNHKGLVVMAADTLTYFLMMLCIGFRVGPASFFPLALSISIPTLGLVWGIFLIIRYLPVSGLTKIGCVVALLSLFEYWGNQLIAFLAVNSMDSSSVMVYSQPSIGFMVIGTGIGIILAVIGLFLKKRENSNV